MYVQDRRFAKGWPLRDLKIIHMIFMSHKSLLNMRSERQTGTKSWRDFSASLWSLPSNGQKRATEDTQDNYDPNLLMFSQWTSLTKYNKHKSVQITNIKLRFSETEHTNITGTQTEIKHYRYTQRASPTATQPLSPPDLTMVLTSVTMGEFGLFLNFI